MDPTKILGNDYVLSATHHSERSFQEGTNRTKTLLTEIIPHEAWELQISKALSKMKP